MSTHNDWYDQSTGTGEDIRALPEGGPGAAETEAQRAAASGQREAPRPDAKAGPAQTPKRRFGSRGKAISIFVCTLLLVVASVYAFSDRGSARNGFGAARTPSGESGAPGGQGRDDGFGQDIGGEFDDDFDEIFGDDFRSFFEEYRKRADASETHVGSNMRRVPGDANLKLELRSSAGKQELSLQSLYERSIGGVVGVKTYREGQNGYAWGSGVILTQDGYILTNQHMVEGATAADIVLPDGTEESAVLIGEDIQTDVAVLKIDRKGLQTAELGDSNALQVGDHVACIGNPLGSELSGTMTDGIISSISRDISVNGRRMTLLQTNAAINEGNSGGPLMNMYGQVIGIINMKLVNTYGVTIEGIGFAIPSATLCEVANELIHAGAVRGRPGMGVTLGPIPEEVKNRYALPEGLYVFSVSEGGDALRQGVQEGDVLLEVNGQSVRETDEVLALRNALAVGDPMDLTLWRDGTVLHITIHLVDQNEIK